MYNYSTLNWLLKKLYHVILPYHCILCGNISHREQDLCIDCYSELPTPLITCPHCARSLTYPNIPCGTCQKHQPPFDRTFVGYRYQFPLVQLITDLKFHHKLINARLLGECLVEKIYNEWYSTRALPQVIIPMPLHPSRLKERGFNQALEIARPIAKKTGIPIDPTTCVRNRPTLAQATLRAKDRLLNVKNAFSIKKAIHYEHIAVVDDVITTGQTITEFCKTLKKAGAKRIDVWCCARPAFDF